MKMVNTIWLRFDLIRFRKDITVCIRKTSRCSPAELTHSQVFWRGYRQLYWVNTGVEVCQFVRVAMACFNLSVFWDYIIMFIYIIVYYYNNLLYFPDRTYKQLWEIYIFVSFQIEWNLIEVTISFWLLTKLNSV